MPRSKRSVRASGVARSLGAAPANLIQCAVCKRWLPREAIAHIRKKPMSIGPHKGQRPAVCGECYRGPYFYEPWSW